MMKLAVVGTGMIAREVLPRLADWGWEVTALCSTPRSAGAARELAAVCGGPALYTDYPAMLAEAEADAVYLAVPNVLHAAMAAQALEAGRNVIVEKPMTASLAEAEALAALAKEKRLFLYEAITTLYQPGYAILRQQLPRIGRVRLVTCNFSQYSSRYGAFQAGQTPVSFDPAQAGGALMDLNSYNVQWICGLFGPPEEVLYRPNMERGIDTSGVLLLQYPDLTAVSIAAKDCSAPCRCTIQGTRGHLVQDTPTNFCGAVTLRHHGGGEEFFDVPAGHRMEAEFRAFARQMEAGDLRACHAVLAQSLAVSGVLTRARQSAGLIFPGDRSASEAAKKIFSGG